MFCSGQRRKSMRKRQQKDDENKKEEMTMRTMKGRVSNVSIKHMHDQIQKHGSISKSRYEPHTEMLRINYKEPQKTVTPPWTFSFPNINACKYAFNLN
jgi:hypothetical protein